jgi:cytosine/adenosine deaminase-related metal-dependent hydrolase
MVVTVHRAPWVLPIGADPIPDGEVAVRDGVVIAVGRQLGSVDGSVDSYDVDRYVDHDGVLLPGLINAHTHLQYGPAFADLAALDLPFPEWIAEVARRRRAFAEPDWFDQAKASAAQVLSSGTTAVADIVSNTSAAAGRAPLGGISYIEAVAADNAIWALRERARVVAALTADGETGLSPHTPFTLGTAAYADVVAIAREAGLRLHPHLAESTAEVEFVARGTGSLAEMLAGIGLEMELIGRGCGLTPTGYLDSLGALGPDVHVAHGVHVDAADRALLRRRGTAVALCTRSNRILYAGEAPVAAYRAEGNPVAVGTDGLSSCPDLDVLAELRALGDLAVRQGTEPDGLDRWLVEAATAGGSAALGRPDIGRLAPGTRADFAVVQGEPSRNPYTTVVRGLAVATYLAGEKVWG